MTPEEEQQIKRELTENVGALQGEEFRVTTMPLTEEQAAEVAAVSGQVALLKDRLAAVQYTPAR